MVLNLAPQQGLLESEIAAFRSVIDENGIAGELAGRLGVDLNALDRSERSILKNAVSEVQVRSKLWLLDELFKRISSEGVTVLVLGGWCGVLAWLARLSDYAKSATWRSIDVDPKACSIGQKAFGGSVPNLTFSCQNILTIDYRFFAANPKLIVVNTICEHLSDFPEWRKMMPGGALTVLQSNNFRGCPDHINCVDTIEELAAAADFRQILFQGSLELSLFTRFMLIGRV